MADMLMKIREFEDAVYYRIGCDCTDSEHDVDIWAEVVDGVPSVQFSAKMHTNLSKNRFMQALEILFTGKTEMYKEFVLGRENILGLRIALDEIEKKLS